MPFAATWVQEIILPSEVNQTEKDECHIYTMVHYSATNRSEIGSFVEMQMDPETVIQVK